MSDRQPVPARVRAVLERTEEGRALLHEEIRGRPIPRATATGTTTIATTTRKDAVHDQTRYLTEAQTREALKLSERDLARVEVILGLGGKAFASRPGELFFPRQRVADAQLFLNEREGAAADSGARALLLSERLDRPDTPAHLADDSPYSVSAKADELEAEFGRHGFSVGSRRRA